MGVGRAFAASSRRRMFLIAAVYYIIYRNWAALTDFSGGVVGWIKAVFLAIGGALVGADKTIERAARQLATNTVDPVTHTFDLVMVKYTFVSPELGQLAAVFAIVGALSTLLIYVRFGKRISQVWNPNLGIFEAAVIPIGFYVAAVIAASAVAGSIRVPFQGVVYLFQHFDAVVQSARMNASAPRTNMSESALEPVRQWLVNQSVS